MRPLLLSPQPASQPASQPAKHQTNLPARSSLQAGRQAGRQAALNSSECPPRTGPHILCSEGGRDHHSLEAASTKN
jgi:hypothetical protein